MSSILLYALDVKRYWEYDWFYHCMSKGCKSVTVIFKKSPFPQARDKTLHNQPPSRQRS